MGALRPDDSAMRRFLTATSDDAPETASENRFRNVGKRSHLSSVRDDSARRRGLDTAILDRTNRRQRIDQRTCRKGHRVAVCTVDR
jgi:hypothetical protein